MELEFHQLCLRYERLRRRAPDQEKRLLASLADSGQQAPIVVTADTSGAQVVIDGYKRVRALKRLNADTVVATAWALGEAEALMLDAMMRAGGGADAFEQGWLLLELRHRFGLSQDELSRRFDRSKSWVSRRLSLVEELPDEIQERVRMGELVPHAAMKYLVPLARANRAACLKLVAALGKRAPTSRQIGTLYAGWLGGNERTRELLLREPWLYLRAQEEAGRIDQADRSPAQQLLGDLGALGAISRRAYARLEQGLARKLSSPERDEVTLSLAQTRAETDRLFQLFEKELH